MSVFSLLFLSCVSEPLAPPAPSVVTEPQATPVSPVQWTLRVDEKQVNITGASGELDVGGKNWSCGYSIDPLVAGEVGVEQWGTLDCRNRGTGVALDTSALCMTSGTRPSDCARANLSLSVGDGESQLLTLSCQVGPSCALPALEVGSAGGKRGTAFERLSSPHLKAGQSGAFTWQLEVNGAGKALQKVPLGEAANTLPLNVEPWACTHRVWAARESNYTQADLASITCTADGASFATEMLCVSADQGPYCGMSVLRLADGRDVMQSMSLACETQGNPGCI